MNFNFSPADLRAGALSGFFIDRKTASRIRPLNSIKILGLYLKYTLRVVGQILKDSLRFLGPFLAPNWLHLPPGKVYQRVLQ